jgi:nucleoside 2-deoxyribosyltransferase
LIGSLRNPLIPEIGNQIRSLGWDVFDDWFSAGPEADDYWQQYENARGHTYDEALKGYAARHVYEFDLHHLKRCATSILVMPAGRSGHIEFGWMLGQGKPGWILFDKEPERYDVMYQFADGVFFSLDDLLGALVKYEQTRPQ